MSKYKIHIDDFEAMQDYKSPINLAINEWTEEMVKNEDNQIMVQIEHQVGVVVDKDELIKALDYDREQYRAGYKAGYYHGYKIRTEEFKELKNRILSECNINDDTFAILSLFLLQCGFLDDDMSSELERTMPDEIKNAINIFKEEYER